MCLVVAAMVMRTVCSEGKRIGVILFLRVLLFFQHAVASGTIASVDKPLLRLEFYVSKASSKVEEAGLAKVLPENQMQTSIAEFTRAQLQTLIGAMDAIEQVCLLLPEYSFGISCNDYRFLEIHSYYALLRSSSFFHCAGQLRCCNS